PRVVWPALGVGVVPLLPRGGREGDPVKKVWFQLHWFFGISAGQTTRGRRRAIIFDNQLR
ncbi:hypothetical protein, partial [Pseudomonas aeruginosa]|uniref:hypothetical protein n=1 Tax=Pseudomonas aeruginosa TaxID=287 RepID=UPI001C3EDE1E